MSLTEDVHGPWGTAVCGHRAPPGQDLAGGWVNSWELAQSDQGALRQRLVALGNVAGWLEEDLSWATEAPAPCGSLVSANPVAGFSALHALLQHGNALGSRLAITDSLHVL